MAAPRFAVGAWGFLRMKLVQIFTSWNPMAGWMRQIDEFQRAA
jgi:hypothetical protein